MTITITAFSHAFKRATGVAPKRFQTAQRAVLMTDGGGD